MYIPYQPTIPTLSFWQADCGVLGLLALSSTEAALILRMSTPLYTLPHPDLVFTRDANGHLLSFREISDSADSSDLHEGHP